MASAHENENVRYEPNENPPSLVAVGAGIQAAMITVAPVVLTVVIVAADCRAARLLHIMGSLRCADSQRRYDCSPGRSGRAGRGRARAHHGHVGCLHRGVCCRPGEGRSGDYGEPHRRVVAIPVCAGGAALAAASDIHTGGCRYGNHADSGNGHANRIRFADGCARGHVAGRRAGGRHRYLGGCCWPRAARPARVAVMVSGYRNSGGLRGVGSLRVVRLPADIRCAMGGRAFRLVAGIRRDSRCRILGTASSVCCGYLGGRYRDHWRRSSHPEGLPTQAACNGLSSGAGRSQRRRRGQSSVGHTWNPAEYDLLIQHLSCGGHGNRRPACGRYYRRHLRGAGILPESCRPC